MNRDSWLASGLIIDFSLIFFTLFISSTENTIFTFCLIKYQCIATVSLWDRPLFFSKLVLVLRIVRFNLGYLTTPSNFWHRCRGHSSREYWYLLSLSFMLLNLPPRCNTWWSSLTHKPSVRSLSQRLLRPYFVLSPFRPTILLLSARLQVICLLWAQYNKSSKQSF